ncbi:phospholipase A [Ereboglobus sp. PH5-10]|uniref:phospholipase A n=1 Tax=Ereboglobus sp. PH5-10 TaxID=2940629 RepID=UPI002404DCE3|nr:phospholipase A [Ereboglobus sp. PH5-10]
MKIATQIAKLLALSCIAFAAVADVLANTPALDEPSPIVFSLLAPSGAVGAGDTITVNLVALNTADYSVDFEAPASLKGELSVAKGAPIPVALQIHPKDVRGVERITTRGFVSCTYTLALPNGAVGGGILTLREPPSVRAAIEIKPASAQASDAADTAPLDSLQPPPVVKKIKRSFLENFSTYEPVYFIYGPDDPAAKFQFSFMYRILADEGYLARKFPVLKGLSFAYTQRSLWDIEGDSSPFYDTSYMPELFCAYMMPAEKTKGGGFNWLGWQAGIGHESNGRDGDASRSMNKVSARALVSFGNLDGWRMILMPRIWGYIGDMSDNPDLDDYRGYGDLTVTLGKNDSVNLVVHMRAGQRLKKGAVQVDLTYPLDAVFKNFAGYFMIQYWNGYGESLLNYDKRTDTIRFGISLVR